MRRLAELPLDALRARLTGQLPSQMCAGGQEVIDVTVENTGPHPIATLAPNPVQLGTRWFGAGDLEPASVGPRTPLHERVRSGERQSRLVRLVAPETPGAYRLCVSPVQEHVAWYDDIDAASGLAADVRVTGPTPLQDPGGLPGLSEMLAELEDADVLYGPSAFWRDLAGLHLALLRRTGFEHFKRSVNMAYFQWPLFGWRDDQLRAALRRWAARPTPALLAARPAGEWRLETVGPSEPRSALQRRAYALAVAATWESARAGDRWDLTRTLAEPAIGDPVVVHHRGRAITQDLANSVLELEAILAALPRRVGRGDTLLEIGAGYGRFAWAAATALDGLRVVIVDIPPALAIAQRYLSETLAPRRAFHFRRFTSAKDVRDELAVADLAFLTPNQLELVDPLGARLAVNISSLHEMRPEQIRRTLELVDRHCDGWMYTKQWVEWRNPADGVLVRQADYPYPAHWRRVFERRHPIQRAFFEGLYATSDGRGASASASSDDG